MTEEFNLSEKIGNIGAAEYFHRKDIEPTKDYEGVLLEEDVKEFIRRIKEDIKFFLFNEADKWDALAIIEKYAGNRLIDKQDAQLKEMIKICGDRLTDKIAEEIKGK